MEHPHEPPKSPKLQCPDCGGVFRTLDWWQPGMPCPSCQGRSIAPVVEVVKEASGEGSEAVKAAQTVEAASAPKGWKRNYWIGAAAALVILISLGSLLLPGSRRAKPVGQPYVCDRCGHKFSARQYGRPGAVACPTCRQNAAYPAILRLCPHCGKSFELVRVRPVGDPKPSAPASAPKRVSPQEAMRASFDFPPEYKVPGGAWIGPKDPAYATILQTEGRVCPACAKKLGAGLRNAYAW